ncbi:MAG: carbohydrate ABC transporter permease [Lachnospiraceae bacterium]|nr:carbohydrate ABC transporter permease [Lachnospiraceae bacterium]
MQNASVQKTAKVKYRKDKVRPGHVILLVMLILLGLLFISPLFISFMSAFKTNGEILKNPLAFPSALYTGGFEYLFAKTDFPKAFFNSIFLTVVSECLIILVIPMGAYGISRTRSKLSTAVYTFFLAGMMIPFQAYMVALFRELNTIGIFGTLAGPVVIYIAGATGFGTLLFTSFVSGIPREIEEAAQIDGCSSLRTFWQIVFPLLKPCTASMVILNGLGIWNDYLMPSLVLPSTGAKTINVEIYRFAGELSSRWDIVFSGVVCGIVPILIVFFALQGYFVKGITAGAAKG